VNSCASKLKKDLAPRHVTLVKYPVINYEWRKDLIVVTTNGEYVRRHLLERYSVTVNQVMVVTEVMPST